MDDSIRLIIGTDLLTENELAIIKEKAANTKPKIAIDGIAVIIHKDNNDTLLTTQQLQKVLTVKSIAGSSSTRTPHWTRLP